MSEKFIPFSINVGTEQEANALVQLIDAGNRHLGANGAGITVLWMSKLQAANQMAHAARTVVDQQREEAKKGKKNVRSGA